MNKSHVTLYLVVCNVKYGVISIGEEMSAKDYVVFVCVNVSRKR